MTTKTSSFNYLQLKYYYKTFIVYVKRDNR